jgi:iron complex transport system substrate-binding protein
VHVFNHRSVAGILRMVQTLGGLIGQPDGAAELVLKLSSDLKQAQTQAQQWARRPCVYFEEWDEPLISGIQWVSELIDIAGGRDCFAELSQASLAKDRIIADPSRVVERAPDIIIGSWCGKKFRPEKLAARAGFADIPAVQTGHVYEIKSPLILQPGPAAITEGLAHIQAIIARWQTGF